MNPYEFHQMMTAAGNFLEGTLDSYANPATKETTITYTDLSGHEETMALRDIDLHTGTPTDVFRKVLDRFGKTEDAKVTQAIGDGTSPDEKRMAAINAELDIIRGRVPTPAGYVIDIQHAKDLMDELRTLMENQQ